jgi:ubiquinone/menaquinone biosynthesis C-methylase UbiE
LIQSGNLYADLSGYYDLFCAQVDYAEQCAFTKRVFDCFTRSTGQQYLDLACGTGAHIELMQGYGFVATGVDNSSKMLELAAKRCPDAHYILSDMSAFDAPGRYDLISCFLYSIHYSHPHTQLKLTLKRVFEALEPGGVFIFNAVDIKGITSRHFVSTQLETQNSTLTFVSGWSYQGQGELMQLQLSISLEATSEAQPSSEKQVWQDRHTMAAVSIEDIRSWLVESGFEVTLLEHDYSCMQPWSGASFNILVVASKPL